MIASNNISSQQNINRKIYLGTLRELKRNFEGLSTKDSIEIANLCSLLNQLDKSSDSLSQQQIMQYAESSIVYLSRLCKLLESGERIPSEKNFYRPLRSNSAQLDSRTEKILNALTWKRRKQISTLIRQATINPANLEDLRSINLIDVIEKIKCDIEQYSQSPKG